MTSLINGVCQEAEEAKSSKTLSTALVACCSTAHQSNNGTYASCASRLRTAIRWTIGEDAAGLADEPIVLVAKMSDKLLAGQPGQIGRQRRLGAEGFDLVNTAIAPVPIRVRIGMGGPLIEPVRHIDSSVRPRSDVA